MCAGAARAERCGAWCHFFALSVLRSALVLCPDTHHLPHLNIDQQMDRSWVHGRLFSAEHIHGVNEFMRFIEGKFSENDEILCPCSQCLNQKYLKQDIVKKHILMNGMDSIYTRWIHHEENLDTKFIEHPIDVNDSNDEETIGLSKDDNCGPDVFEEILGYLYTAGVQDKQNDEDEDGPDDESFMAKVMKEAKHQLYPGCTKFSKFSFVETCHKNKDNRSQVKFHQTTGSRSYMVLVENLEGNCSDEEPDALDLFKECHYSKKKKVFTPAVQLAIIEMESKIHTPTEGEESISATQTVALYLLRRLRRTSFF